MQSVLTTESSAEFSCAMQYTLWKQTVHKVQTEKGYHKGFLKRVEQLKKEHEDNILLYNDIRSQRNRFLRLVEVSCIVTQCKVIHSPTLMSTHEAYIKLIASFEQESGITIAEMKDKLAPLNQQVENLQNDVTYKLKVFDKLHKQVLEGMEACGYVRADISKCNTEIAQKKVSTSEIPSCSCFAISHPRFTIFCPCLSCL